MVVVAVNGVYGGKFSVVDWSILFSVNLLQRYGHWTMVVSSSICVVSGSCLDLFATSRMEDAGRLTGHFSYLFMHI